MSAASASPLRLTRSARLVLERRYLKRNLSGEIVETPEEMVDRVARAVAQVEERFGQSSVGVHGEFARIIGDLSFLPNSPTLMNAGRELGQLSACFTLPVEDSIPGIFDAVKWAARIQMTGGGTGFSFSSLRPSGDLVASTRGVASGPVAFIDVFNAATDAIKQGGTRRGANMGILRVDHPDILEFVTAKSDLSRWKNFNVSVSVTDEFMRAAQADDEYPLRNPRTGQVVRTLRARRLFDLIAQLAWRTAEPGLLFIDRINERNPTPQLGSMESTNPCAELPLLPFESCNLGSIDVSRFVVGDNINYAKLRPVVHAGIHFLDNVIEANRYPLPEIEHITRANRKVGLGVMGWADALIRMGIPYDSEDALARADSLMSFVEVEARRASERLAVQRGAFVHFMGSRWQMQGAAPLRNATMTAIAPTGTISIIAGCSSGVEPLYALSYVRRVLEGERLVETHSVFQEIARARGFYSERLMAEVAERGNLREVDGIPDDVRRLFVTAYDVAPEWHVRMQAAFQRNCDNAVSKTVNLPRNATVDDIARIYRLAYELGCKGITIYRDGSRDEQVLSVGDGAGAVVEPERCNDCGSPLTMTEGCAYCLSCGWARCAF
jgi:ribonucleoside-diphosphate reductase alpha chain